MRQSLFVLLAALTTLALTACEVEPEDPDATDTSDATDQADDDVETDTVPEPSYRFVRINDQSAAGDTADAGADIDAVLLEKSDGSTVAAATVEGFVHGGGLGSEVDPTAALNMPDAFSDWEGADPVCDLSTGYVSLGGSGGLLIVGMPQDIETGDTITVLEVGGCTGNDGAEGIVEDIEVEISVANDIDGAWTSLGTQSGPVATFTVPAL